MKAFVVVAMVAFATVVQVLSTVNMNYRSTTTLSPFYGDYGVDKCIADTGVTHAEVMELRALKVTTTDNCDAAKRFLLCYFTENEMFVDNKPVVKAIYDHYLPEDPNIFANLAACDLDGNKTYTYQELYELFKCFKSKAMVEASHAGKFI